ncbi:MAG: DUF4437 domain-containing protein [Saprospiraceae bacterium]|nr:DUF4437 domain-containing protein [Saprospiraceae bacterium]
MRYFLVFIYIGLLTACENPSDKSESDTTPPIINPTNEVVLQSEVQWAALNPARGDKGPKAANLWGDRTQSGPTGFLVQFVDGFSSPPHIHNVTYRGMVISGLLHNDDPQAEKMWLPAGSFWTQPAGEVHITAASGSSNLAYIEIDSGPYLVLPSEEASDNGERPVNVDKSNIVWLDASNLTWIDHPENSPSSQGVKMAFLWGTPQREQLHWTLLKLPTGFSGEILSKGSVFRAVVIGGEVEYQMPGESDAKTLDAGSYFGSTGEAVHTIASHTSSESFIYIRTDNKYEVLVDKN